MTSVDSGIETSNNSDDSSIAQNEDMSTDEISTASSAVVTINNTQNDICETKPENPRFEINPNCLVYWPSEHLPFLSLSSMNENYKYPEEIENSTSITNSGPILLPSNVPEIKFHYSYGSSRTTPYLKLLNKKAAYCMRRMKYISALRRSHHYHSLSWVNSGPYFIECRMRIAAITNDTITMRQLLVSGISPNNHDEQGRTPLHLASCRGYTEIVHLLLEHGADPNRRDCVGNTPLHLAVVTGKISVVTLLLNAGTNLLILDRKSYNPLQLAQTKLKLLQNCKGEDMMRLREEVQNVKSMLLAYLRKQKDTHKNMDTLSTFYSRLTLSNPSDQVQDDVNDLLTNLNALSITQ